MASNTVVSRKALADASGAVTSAFVAAFSPRMQVIGIYNVTNPGEIMRASSQGAIRPSPFSLAIQASVALAIVVVFTSAVTRALVLAQSTHSKSALIPNNLTPRFGLVRRRAGWVQGGLTRGLRSGLS